MKEQMKEEMKLRGLRLARFTSHCFSLLLFALFTALIIPAASSSAHAQKKQRKPASGRKVTIASARIKGKPPTAPVKSITVKSEPQAVVWLDEVRRGVTDESGQFEITKVLPGRHVLRVRAAGFAEAGRAFLTTSRYPLLIPLTRTTDEAEIAFQRAEDAREHAASDEARVASAELYRRAITLRPRFAAAHVGLARIMFDLNDYEAALAEVDEARKSRPVYAEAAVVEGRILRATSQNDEAVAAYELAIREARGFQPEAYTGLGIIYEEAGKYEEAAAAFRKAIAQLPDTEPVLYELLGRTYERLEKYKEAVAAYEKYLELAPNGKLAPAIESVIEQLRKQAAGQDAPPSN